MTGTEHHFAADYASARERFRSAATERGARLEGFAIGPRAPGGEELTIDTAELGPADARSVLLVTSGIHGVEGYAGSAIQHRLLRDQLDGLELPSGVRVLLVHAVNPYGFAHTRRVNENNVDLNRNFLRHPSEHVPNPDYESLYDAINPVDLDDAAALASLQAFGETHGPRRLQAALANGQYTHRRGMQFGGAEEEESVSVMRRILRERVAGRRVVWLDMHTGLGNYGGYELIVNVDPADAAYKMERRRFGEAVRSVVSDDSVSTEVAGDMLAGGVAELGAEGEVLALAPEFGTYDPMRVFAAMRADNWLRHHGDVASERGHAILEELVEVFRPADPRWQAQVLAGAAQVIQQARDHLAEPAAAGRPSS